MVTNGVGGYASGTVAGLNTRRYHGVLVAAFQPPTERTLLVSKLDATVAYRGARYPLFSNEFADGTVDPRGFIYLNRFELDGLIPVWTYALSDALIEIRLWMPHRRNTTYVTYSCTRAAAPIELSVSPLCTYRGLHEHGSGGWHPRLRASDGGFELTAFEGAVPFRVVVDQGEFEERPDWHWGFKHGLETYRGLDDTEDLFCPGEILAQLREGDSVAVVCSVEAVTASAARAALLAERRREESLLKGCPAFGQIPERLALAADQFLVGSVNRRSRAATVIAGYPWFGAWSRDTMIALPGLTLSTGRPTVAAKILKSYSASLSEGMLPNRFPEGREEELEYNTVDGTLWYFVALYQYLRSTGDIALAKELFAGLVQIVEAHRRGTRYGIHVDPEDELLYAGEPGIQLTWMDARVGDWVVTPRMGKPVEVNALWYNALCIVAELARRLRKGPLAQEYGAAARAMRRAFEKRFWYAEGGYLYDVVDGPDGDDASLRPNQLFALSLPFPLVELSGHEARAVVDVCARELWTPQGLRTLAATDQRYVGVYGGGTSERDGAYHQGTVWPWLLGSFATSHYRVCGNAVRARSFLTSIIDHLHDAGLGSIGEIFDGDAPHEPRGCYAQAWSVSEVLRAWVDLEAADESDDR